MRISHIIIGLPRAADTIVSVFAGEVANVLTRRGHGRTVAVIFGEFECLTCDMSPFVAD